VDEERVAALIAELDGKDINELLAIGKQKLQIGGGGGGGVIGVASAAPAPAAAPAAAGGPAAAKKEEKKEEEEEIDLGGGMDM
jgi:ribosomal protein L12E/L44/L45/RPP1/RPP2